MYITELDRLKKELKKSKSSSPRYAREFNKINKQTDMRFGRFAGEGARVEREASRIVLV